MTKAKKNLPELEVTKKMKNVNKTLSSKLKRGICCQLQSEGYIDMDQLTWLLNEIKDE